LVQLFDYLRATAGEVPEEDVRAYLEALAAGALPPFEVARVLEAYDRYLRHVDAVQAALAAPSEAGDGPEAALDRVHAMRIEAFGAADAERAFGADERLARTILERQRIAEDPTLTAEARDARLSALEATLPDEVAARWAQARALTGLRDRTAALRAGGSDAESEAEIEALRVETVGREAAARLAELDEARAGWGARVEAYHADLRAWSGDRGALSEAEVAAVARAHFEGPELVRIAALERIEREANAAREERTTCERRTSCTFRTP
jgi:lipase chaperone LimK